MSRSSFEVVFDGEALEAGRMDSGDLAVALLGVGATIRAANRALNGDQIDARIDVVADFRAGSFPVSLETVIGVWQQVQGVVLGADFKTADVLLRLIGFKASAREFTRGAVTALKKLRGRKPDLVEPQPNGTVNIHIDNQTINIYGDSMKLLEDSGVRSGLEQMVRPLARKGVDRVSFRSADEVGEEIVDDEAPGFAAPRAAVAAGEEAPLLSSAVERLLAVEKVWFRRGKKRADHHKWVLTDGQTSYSVTIEDEHFLDQVARDEASFSVGTVLRVLLRTDAFADGRDLRTTYAVERVLGKHRMEEQPGLFRPTE